MPSLGMLFPRRLLQAHNSRTWLSAGSVPNVRAGRVETPAIRTAQVASALVLWRLPQLLGASGGLSWPVVTDFLPTHLVAAHAISKKALTSAQAQTAITDLDASLVKVEGALAVAAADPNYTYTLADPSQPSSTAATVKVGSAEIQVLAAAVSAVRSLTNLSLAYNADPGTFDFNAVIPQSAFSGGTLPAAHYLPASPFLTLNPDGTTRMAAVGSELNNVAVQGVAAIEAVKTRNSNGYLLNPGTLVSTGQLTSAETQIKSVQAYLTGTQTITLTMNGQTFPTQIALSAFIAHPPADLKALLPALQVSADGTYVTRAAFPDTTFGGLFPGGLPIDQGAAAATPYYLVSSGVSQQSHCCRFDIPPELGGL